LPGVLLTKEQRQMLLTEPFDLVPDDRWKAFLRTMFRAESTTDREDAESYLSAFKAIFPAVVEIHRDGHSFVDAMPQNVFRLWLILSETMGLTTFRNHFSVMDSWRFGLAPP
jgi:hypothetical protein